MNRIFLSLHLIHVLVTTIGLLLLASLLRIVNPNRKKKTAVGFFHPYTNDGSVGETVLWCAVRAIQTQYPHLLTVIFTVDPAASPRSLMSDAAALFGVRLLYPPKVVHLIGWKLVENGTFTIMGQSLESVILALEALTKFTPFYFFDTSGYAFTYPIARFFGCKVISYTHYPTITLDTICRLPLTQGSSMYNNNHALTATTR